MLIDGLGVGTGVCAVLCRALELEAGVNFAARMLDLICESELLAATSSMFADREKTLWYDQTESCRNSCHG